MGMKTLTHGVSQTREISSLRVLIPGENLSLCVITLYGSCKGSPTETQNRKSCLGASSLPARVAMSKIINNQSKESTKKAMLSSTHAPERSQYPRTNSDEEDRKPQALKCATSREQERRNEPVLAPQLRVKTAR